MTNNERIARIEALLDKSIEWMEEMVEDEHTDYDEEITRTSDVIFDLSSAVNNLRLPSVPAIPSLPPERRRQLQLDDQ